MFGVFVKPCLSPAMNLPGSRKLLPTPAAPSLGAAQRRAPRGAALAERFGATATAAGPFERGRVCNRHIYIHVYMYMYIHVHIHLFISLAPRPMYPQNLETVQHLCSSVTKFLDQSPSLTHIISGHYSKSVYCPKILCPKPRRYSTFVRFLAEVLYCPKVLVVEDQNLWQSKYVVSSTEIHEFMGK